MVASSATLQIGVYGLEEHACTGGRGCSLWPVGYSAALGAAGAVPITLRHRIGRQSWADVLGGLHGLVWAGKPHEDGCTSTQEQRLCQWCRKNNFPLLAVDHGLHALNAVFGGTLHLDLARELPARLATICERRCWDRAASGRNAGITARQTAGYGERVWSNGEEGSQRAASPRSGFDCVWK